MKKPLLYFPSAKRRARFISGICRVAQYREEEEEGVKMKGNGASFLLLPPLLFFFSLARKKKGKRITKHPLSLSENAISCLSYPRKKGKEEEAL